MATIPNSLSDALKQLRYLLNDTDSSYYNYQDPELENWIKEGCVDVSSKTLCVEAIDTTSVVLAVDAREYPQPAGCVKVFACVYTGETVDRGLQRMHPRMLSHTDNPNEDGPPRFFYHFASKIGVFPKPTASEVGKICHVYFSKITEDITELPDEYQIAPILYALSQAYLREEDVNQSQAIYNRYAMILNYHREDLYNQKLYVESFDYLKIPDMTITEEVAS